MVNNLRVISDNAANRTATLTTSSTAGSLIAANMLTNSKPAVWRSTSTTASITATWATSELVGCVALPFTNLTPTATIRVRGYTEAADATASFDTGTVAACPYTPLGLWDWGSVQLGVNAFSYGGKAYASVWFPITTVKKLVIDIVDTDNASDYIEVSRLVTGTYWTPEYNAEYGAQLTAQDSSKHERTDAGDLHTDVGTRSNKLSVNLSVLTQSDRAAFWSIVRGNGMSKPLFFSLFPEHSDDPTLEQTYQVYGKISSMSAIAASTYNIYSAPIEIEEI